MHVYQCADPQKEREAATGIDGLLGEEAAAAGTGSFVFTSSTSAFGRALTPPPGAPTAWITEDVTPVPRNIYGVTKTAAENLAEIIHHERGLPVIVLRTARFFPERDDAGDVRNAYADENIKANEFLYRRADLQDVAEGVRDADDTEDVRVVDGLHVGRGHVGGRLPVTGDARVVDEHIEPGCLLAELFGGGLHRLVAGDVDEQETRPDLVGGLLAALLVARSDVDGVPGGDQLAGGLTAQALVGSGDQYGAHDSSLPWWVTDRKRTPPPGTGGTSLAVRRSRILEQLADKSRPRRNDLLLRAWQLAGELT